MRYFLYPQPEHKPSHAFGIKHSPYLGSLKGDAWGGKTVVVESGRGINSAAIAALKTSSATTNGHAAAWCRAGLRPLQGRGAVGGSPSPR